MDISDNYAYKVLHFLEIKSETKHQEHYRPHKVKKKFPHIPNIGDGKQAMAGHCDSHDGLQDMVYFI